MSEELEIHETEEGLFDDYVEDMPIENEEQVEKEDEAEEKVESVEEQEVVEEQPELPFLEVKFNKELKGLSKAEAKEYAERGLNYDRLLDKYNNEHNELERIARLNGMDVDNFIRTLGDTQVQFEVKKEMESLRTQNPDAPEELLKELAESRVTNRIGRNQNEEELRQKEQSDAQLESVRRDVNFLKGIYPDFDPEHIPQEVFDKVDMGMDLVKAYVTFQKEQADKIKPQVEAQAKTEKLNEENKKKSLGSTTNAGSQEQDDFLSGFFNG